MIELNDFDSEILASRIPRENLQVFASLLLVTLMLPDLAPVPVVLSVIE
jgi:hypothetical protein